MSIIGGLGKLFSCFIFLMLEIDPFIFHFTNNRKKETRPDEDLVLVIQHRTVENKRVGDVPLFRRRTLGGA